ncbi:5'-methylthioadenosine/adenosylhomocysteine nucleosidase [Streptococcus entericus]|uniref:5'-methylthioadenosine/adenosylhomocysteine nucleosidase n=1 Tax=Streptococcus entericus TaxID=155680 RepID=UPI0003827DF9|nr:5'-methylthioadenosine/adenosylhomocysteine nucleosidase [Streptococcus entericus]
MTIGIIAAMPQELAELLLHLDNRSDETVLGRTYHTGRLSGQSVVLVQSGVGKVMSAMSVAVLADHFGVTAVINTGSAGAVAQGLAVGDVVLADQLVYHDVDLTAFGYAYGQMSGQPLYFDTDERLRLAFSEAIAEQDLASRVGLIATGDSFIASSAIIQEIKAHFPQVLAVEMEGAAIAQAAHSLDLPVLVVRAMSDTADHEANISFDTFIIEAGKRSAQMVLAGLAKL